MKVAIVGSRDFAFTASPEDTDRFIAAIVDQQMANNERLTILSGGARGVDTYVREACMARGFHECLLDAFAEAEFAHQPYHFVEYLALWRGADGKLNRGAGFARNRRVVAEAQEVIALFADGPATPGTKHVFTSARQLGTPVHVYHEGVWTLYG